MDCAQCGETNREGARFCGECGSPLARHCSSCQAELDPKLKFCDACGASTAATASAVVPDGAVRKTVTALFADLAGSTGFGERIDAEVARSVMGRYHALLQTVVDAHGGTVAKFMGDGMMATFGIPEIAEDDAIRAVRAGVDMQRRFHDFAATVAAQLGETLGLRVGVNTGEVVIASGDADLVGDALNVAARIEHACRPGEVAVGEETWRLTRGELGYEALGEVRVAGRAEPVAIYEVVSGAAAVETASPFVGRDAEMQRLRDVFDTAVTARAARLVTVLGSPGVGKTRLSRELCTATEAADNAVTFEIRCDRAGDETFAPVAQLIREATGLGDGADAALARERLGILFADDETDRDRLVDILGGLVGAAPTRSVEETFWAVRRLVSATAARRPMVVVIDDIQWAEPLLLDLLEHLTEWVHDVPLLLLCLARPELREVRPSLAERNARVVEVLPLDGLDSAATEALAAGLLGTDRLPAGLVERLPTSTDGNPLFVREFVRMLVDDQIIRRRGEEWELTIDAAAVEVPPTIQSLLATRVERLPHDERNVLELASVIGAEFNAGALRELSGPDAPLPTRLESLRRKELVEPTGAYWGDEPVYRFHHVLIRDAAYRRLLKTTRAELHEKVAVWTDAAAANRIGEHEAVTAFHYEQAHRYRVELGTVDDHATELGRRAAELLATAADRALGRDDLAAAGAFASRALALLPEADGDARADLLLIASECTLASGDVVSARPVVEQLRVAAGDSPALGAWASCFEAQLIGLTDPDGLVGAEALATGAAKVMEELGDGAGEAKAHQVRAGLLARLGHVGDAELELDLALGAARRVDDRRRVTAVLGAAPNAALWGPSPVARAGGRCLDVVRLLRITTASPSVEATSMRCQAVLEALRGRFDVARSMLASSRATLEELGLRHGLLETAYLTGVVELVADDPAAAIGPLRDAYEGLIEMGVGIDAGRAAALLAHALVAVGRVDDAEPVAAASEELAGQDLKTAIAWRGARAEVLAARGDVAGGIALAREAVDIAAATDLVIDHADACVTLAALHAQADDAAAALSVRAEAKRLYDVKGATIPAERLADNVVPTPAPVTISTPAPLRTAPPMRPAPDDADPRHDRAENLAATLGTRLFELFVTGQMDQLRALLADDAVLIDKRSIIGMNLVGGDAIVESLRAALDLGLVAARVEPLAVRGSTLALGRITTSYGGFESQYLNVGQVNVDGRISHTILFEEDALADALAELDARYFAGEGREIATAMVGMVDGISATNRHDWAGLIDGYAPDFAQIDHRQLGWPTVDREGVIAMLQGYVELAPDLFLLSRTYHVRNHAVLVTLDGSGTTTDGNVMEWVQHYVAVFEDRGTTRAELFDEHEFDAALARLDELGAAPPSDPRHPRAENLAATLGSRLWESFAAGQMDQVRALIADDAVSIDKRSIIGMDLVGGDAMVASLREVADLGVVGARWEPLAVRGSRLVLGRITIQFGSFEIVFLIVGELNDAGLLSYSVNFDDDALVDALAELDARYFAGEGSAFAALHEVGAGSFAAVNARDWDTFRDLYSPNLVCTDRRQIGWPTLDRDGYVQTIRDYCEVLVVDLFLLPRKLEVQGRAQLFTVDASGTTPDGGAVEWVQYTVGVGDPTGMASFEIFDERDFEAALARLDELGAARETRTPDAVNRASALSARFCELLVAGRVDDAAALFAEDAVMRELRPITGIDFSGRDAIIENFRVVATLPEFDNMQDHTLAVRGERLALDRVDIDFGGFGGSSLTIVELNSRGEVQYVAVFDEGALVDAMDELDARYLAGEGAADPLVASFPVVSRFNHRDWAGILGPDFPDFTQLDRRQLGWPTVDRHGYVATMREYVDLVPDLVIVARKLYARGRTGLATIDGFGTTVDGSPVEWCAHSVTCEGPDGSVSIEVFDEHDFAAALARFDEFGAVGETRTPDTVNRASLLVADFYELVGAGRIDDAAGLFADDGVMDDRRPIIGGDLSGRDAIADNFRVVTSLPGFDTMHARTLAVRGERLVLHRITVDAAEFQVVLLQVVELNANGQARYVVVFDEDAFDDAVAELDARYRVGEGAARAADLETGRRFSDCMNSGEWDVLLPLMTEDFAVIDTRRLSWPTSNRDGFVEVQRSYGDLSPRIFARSVHLRGNALLSVNESSGVDAEGGEFVWIYHSVVTFTADHRVSHMELFDENDFAAALARLDELGAADPRRSRVENETTRSVDAFFARAIEGRFDAAAELLTRDIVRLDHRTAVSDATTHGRDEYMAALQATFAVGFAAVTVDHLAVRGERLALFRSTFTTDSGMQLVILSVGETDADERVSFLALYDDDALDDAVADLDARFLAGEGLPHAAIVEAANQILACTNTRDWTRARSLLSKDFTFRDARQLGWSELDRDGFIAMQESYADQVRLRNLVQSVRVAGRAILFTMVTVGTDPDGGEFEWVWHGVNAFDADHRCRSQDMFDADDFASAVARFDELAALARETRTPHVDNAVVRALMQDAWRKEFDESYDEAAAMEAGIVADIVIDDRRRGVSVGVLRGPEELRDNVRAQSEMFGPTTFAPIAGRGDRLALFRTLAVSATGFELVSLAVAEINSAGHYCAWTFFDESDLRVALDLLDERHRAIRTDAPGIAERGFTRERDAFERGDWDEVAACFAPEFVAIDHRPLGFAPATAEEYIARSRELVASAPELHGFARKSYYAPRAVLAALTFVGTSTEGSEYEWDLVMVAQSDEQGRYLRLEYFAEDQWSEALARFDEFAATPEALTERQLGLSAIRMDALNRGDRDAVLATYTPDFVRDDRRRGVNFGASNREETVDALLAGNEVGLANREFTVVETVGDHCTLVEFRMSHDDGFELVYLLLTENDEQGRLRRAANFDVEDRAAASALLHEWAAERR